MLRNSTFCLESDVFRTCLISETISVRTLIVTIDIIVGNGRVGESGDLREDERSKDKRRIWRLEGKPKDFLFWISTSNHRDNFYVMNHLSRLSAVGLAVHPCL